MEEPALDFDYQKAVFERPDQERFVWQTGNGYVRERERYLLEILAHVDGESLLEVGCGEGANLCNLGDLGRNTVGLDFSPAKVKCASENNPHATFACADAMALPFPDDSFDIVFCRDLLHHVEDRSAAVGEMIRVCRPGKHVVIIEANGRNPWMKLFGTLVKHEAGVKTLTHENLSAIMDAHRSSIQEVSSCYVNLSAFWRLFVHYKFGLSGLGERRLFRSFASLTSTCVEPVTRESRLFYMRFYVVKR